MLNCPPTFGMYAFDAAVNDAAVVDVPRGPAFEVDVPALLAAARAQPRPPKLLFLASPNNPDGGVLSDGALLQLLAGLPSTLVVLDEAYVEFTDAPSRCPWVVAGGPSGGPSGGHRNLAVLRTFSKRAALAGLRVGYGCFHASLVPFLWRAKQPYNVSVAADVAARAALSNPGYLARVRGALVAERGALTALLSSFGPRLAPYPSEANFVLCRVAGGAGAARELQRELAEGDGIVVRYYAGPERLAGCVRVSVGTPDHTRRLGVALRRILGG